MSGRLVSLIHYQHSTRLNCSDLKMLAVLGDHCYGKLPYVTVQVKTYHKLANNCAFKCTCIIMSICTSLQNLTTLAHISSSYGPFYARGTSIHNFGNGNFYELQNFSVYTPQTMCKVQSMETHGFSSYSLEQKGLSVVQVLCDSFH